MGDTTKCVKNLAHAFKDEQKQFFNSFDRILCDMDGVIWTNYTPIRGTKDCITNLKKLGKEVVFVTNNATSSNEVLFKVLVKNKFPVKPEDIVTPASAYIDFLNKNNFNKTIYLLGSENLKETFKQANFKIAENPPYHIKEEITELLKNIVDDEEIGAVIIDYDINLTLLKLQKALTYLKRIDCLFIVGAGDKALPFSDNGPLIGNHYFYKSLSFISGREPYQMAKPSKEYSQFIKQKFCIKNPRRVLFIGDSVKEDMKFATTSGFQKLLVLTGITQKEEIQNWKYDEDDIPDYYVDSLEALNLIIGMLK